MSAPAASAGGGPSDGPSGDADRDAPVEPVGRGRVIGIAALMLVLGVGVPMAGLAIAWKSCSHGAIDGRIMVSGSTLGDWRAAIGRCVATDAVIGPGAGEVELGQRDDTRVLVRFTMDPLDGPLLTLTAPAAPGTPSDDRTLLVRGRDCPDLAVELHRTNGADAPLPRFDGKVRGTCPLPGGGAVTVDAWWRGCGG